ncbi:MAG: RNA polymerase sigma factor [Planctomycetota bacterium]
MKDNWYQQSDRELVVAACAGQGHAFAALYERYFGPIKALAYALVRDTHLADDVVQQTFALACQKLPGLRKPEQFAAWLGTICRNTARQSLRAQRRRIDPDCWLQQRSEPDQTSQDLIQQALWRLQRKDREILALRYYDDLPYERIAALLGLSVPAVNGRIARAKQRLKQNLKTQGYFRDSYEDA